ncbi:hypothetical protein ACFOD9_02440 [Novosphingobium bradum]|uniref:Uncharacterized protein n=1 Tax=Novosphingobium bradum TaxID=1737444 RepID=A0ABV7IK81_9SPHN
MATTQPPASRHPSGRGDDPADDRRIYDAPLHVMRGDDGTVSVFFPDGHRLVLTSDAAERSGAILWRTGVIQRQGRRLRAGSGPGKVIAVDFSGSGAARG